MNIELLEKYNNAFEKLRELGIFNTILHYDEESLYYESYWLHFLQLDYSALSQKLDSFEISVLKEIQNLLSMYLSAEDKNKIYIPHHIFNGKRTYAIEDMSNEFTQILFEQAENISSQPIILSRIYDIIWVRKGIDNKNIYEAGKKAFEYYDLFFRELINKKNYYVAHTILSRMNVLVFSLGRQFNKRAEYCDSLLKLLDLPVDEDNLLFFCKIWELVLSINWGNDNNEILTRLAIIIEKYENNTSLAWQEKLSYLLIKIYKKLNLEKEQQDILEKMAERYIREADGVQSISKVHFLSQAIETYRRINKNPHKETIQRLLKEIQELQKNIDDEFQKVEYSIDITNEVNKVLNEYNNADFTNCIGGLWKNKFLFPNEDKMQEIIKQYPKSILVDTITPVYHNHLGQTVKVGGNDYSDYNNKQFYRNSILEVKILPLLNLINERFFFSERSFIDLFNFNPFIPPKYEDLFAKGIYYFIKRMFVESACILIPLLENSLRYMLSETKPTIYKKDNIEIFQNKIEIHDLIELVKKENILDNAILFHLDDLLNDDRNNVRNDLAHGLYSIEHFYSSNVILVIYLIFVLSVDCIFCTPITKTP